MYDKEVRGEQGGGEQGRSVFIKTVLTDLKLQLMEFFEIRTLYLPNIYNFSQVKISERFFSYFRY